jgi:hypothetical protein
MSDLLLIDDDPGPLVTQVHQAFPAPGHFIDVARTGPRELPASAPPRRTWSS